MGTSHPSRSAPQVFRNGTLGLDLRQVVIVGADASDQSVKPRRRRRRQLFEEWFGEERRNMILGHIRDDGILAGSQAHAAGSVHIRQAHQFGDLIGARASRAPRRGYISDRGCRDGYA
jgi:hypothetical protein